MTGTGVIASLAVQPWLPLWLLALLAGLCLIATLAGARRRARGWALRGLVFLVVLGWLLGPMLMRTRSEGLPDIGLLVIDHSASMRIGDRARLAQQARQAIETQAARLRQGVDPGLELRTVELPEAGHDGTRLFAAIAAARATIPPDRLAGVIAITDGMVSDAPAATPAAPLDVLIPAAGEQTDRRLRLIEAPGFGIVHQTATIRAVVEDLGPVPANDAASLVRVTVSRDGQATQALAVHPGEPFEVPVPIAHAGPTLVALSAAALPGEVSALNNHAEVSVNGVRDRLRVLLVSGQPNQAERSWRRLLRADPAVDLVHFTILRRPDEIDPTPIDQLALIPFPMHELFEDKITLFDLIILDRFADEDVLPRSYLARIANYVRRGGGLLLTAGPEFAGPDSLDHTPLAGVLPAHASGSVNDNAFRPATTALGLLHPVTRDLPGGPATAGAAPGWGQWFRSIDVLVADDPLQDAIQHEADAPLTEGDPAAPDQTAPDQATPATPQVLMQAQDQAGGERPLLLLDRVGKGRVALLLSDQSWLWSRDFEGGGPEAELARRLAHWLMAEPQLEEESLTAHIAGGALVVERRTVLPGPPPTVTVTPPGGGATRHLALAQTAPGLASGTLPIDDADADPGASGGAWQVSDGTHHAFAARSQDDPAEFADLRATASVLGPLAEASGGGVHWLDPAGAPELRRVADGAAASGPGWIGLRRRAARLTTGAEAVPLLPPGVALLLIGGLVLLAWRREMA